MGILPEQVPRASPKPLWALDVYLYPFAALFRAARQRPTWESLERYVTGLLTDLPRKNCDTIAAAVAGTTTERLQHLLTDAEWDPLALDALRVGQLAPWSPRGGILALDDTGLPKQGKASAGVARQYSGTLGKVGNCQVVVTAEYVEDTPATSTPVHWPVSGQLYLPKAWADDAPRRQRAHIPAAVVFQTKPALALGLVDRARAWGVPFRHVVADAGYGDVPTFLAGLEARQLPYVVGVSKTFGLRLPDDVRAEATAPPAAYRGMGRPRLPRPAPLWEAEALVECLPDEAWEAVAWRDGPKAPLAKQFVAVRAHRATGNPDTGRTTTHHRTTTGPEGWLLAERPLPGETGERKWYFCWLPALPATAPLDRLVTLAHSRWAIEQAYEDAKGECGLDDYQGRRWDGLHRHLALVWLTYSFLVSQRGTVQDRCPARPAPATPAASPAPPSAAGLSPLRGRTAPPSLAPELPGHPSARAPVALRGPRPLDRRHRSHHPLPQSTLPPTTPLVTK